MKKWNPEPGRISFNPRTPCGVRPTQVRPSGNVYGFQSTHSLRSATDRLLDRLASEPVSIHALLAECDILGINHKDIDYSFNPRTPCGVRQVPESAPGDDVMFQSTHSLRSATLNNI